MKGTPFIYQGDELGLTNRRFDDIGQFNDVWSKNAWCALARGQGNNAWGAASALNKGEAMHKALANCPSPTTKVIAASVFSGAP